ncbi:MAG: hypothetical protein R6U32_02265 [Candidatus Woesearchaeota archaeon]
MRGQSDPRPDKAVLPYDESGSLEENVRRLYEFIGIDFSEKTDFFDVFDSGSIAGFLESEGYKLKPTREDSSALKEKTFSWDTKGSFTEMFALHFFNEKRLSYLYERSKSLKKGRNRDPEGEAVRILSRYYVGAVKSCHDISLELNENSLKKGLLFAQRGIDLQAVSGDRRFCTSRGMRASFHERMAELYVERGISQREEGMQFSTINESLDMAYDHIISSLKRYIPSMLGFLRISIYDFRENAPKEVEPELSTMLGIIEESRKSKRRDIRRLYEMLQAPMEKLEPYASGSGSRLSDRAGVYKAKRIIDTYSTIGKSLNKEGMDSVLENSLNFCFRRLVMLLDRCLDNKGLDLRGYNQLLDKFNRPFQIMRDMGAGMEDPRGGVRSYSEIGSFRRLAEIYARD